MWRRRLRYYILKFLRLKGTPWKVALGFAVGAVVNFYPTFGFGVPLAGALAGFVRGNIPAGLIGDILFKPLFPAFFYLDLLLGNMLIGQRNADISRAVIDLAKLEPGAFLTVGKVFLIGAFINSLLVGLLLFMIIFKVFKSYRRQLIRVIMTQKLI